MNVDINKIRYLKNELNIEQTRLDLKAEEIFDFKWKLEFGKEHPGSVQKVSIDGDQIKIETYTRYCGCCPGDTDYYYFPISYLNDPNWKDIVREEVRVKKEIEQKKKDEEEQKQNIARRPSSER
jgi:hypothetical protein